MPNILYEIVSAKRAELTESKAQISLADLVSAAADQPRPLNLSGALLGGGVRLIAEVKKASPSRGLLMPEFDHLKLAETYASNDGVVDLYQLYEKPADKPVEKPPG